MNPYEFARSQSQKHQTLLDHSYSKEIFSGELLIPYHDGVETIYPTNTLNGSICEYKGRILFAYRIEQEPWFQKTRIGICQLTETFDVIPNTAKLLNLHDIEDGLHNEDPRLFVCNNQLCLSYCDGYRMAMALLDDDLEVYHSGYFQEFQVSNSENHDGREKNWTPFEYKKEPHFVYSDNPRFIIKHNFQKTYIPKQDVVWKWGAIRGGTPAIPYDENNFITFFHSARTYPSIGGWPRLYFMGAYLFKRHPPFEVTAITCSPILKGCPPEYEHPRPCWEVLVIFPAGIIKRDQGFWISYGLNDCCNRVIFITRELLNLSFLYGNLR